MQSSCGNNDNLLKSFLSRFAFGWRTATSTTVHSTLNPQLIFSLPRFFIIFYLCFLMLSYYTFPTRLVLLMSRSFFTLGCCFDLDGEIKSKEILSCRLHFQHQKEVSKEMFPIQSDQKVSKFVVHNNIFKIYLYRIRTLFVCICRSKGLNADLLFSKKCR